MILLLFTGRSGSRVIDLPDPKACWYLPLPVKVVRRDRVEIALPAEFPRHALSPRREADRGDPETLPDLSDLRCENLGATGRDLKRDFSLLLGVPAYD